MKKRSVKVGLLFLSPLFLLSWPLVQRAQRDPLDRVARSLAGPGAVDCGEILASGDDAHKCYNEALEKKQPFFSRSPIVIPPNGTVYGSALSPRGEFYSIRFRPGRFAWSGDIEAVERVPIRVRGKVVTFLNPSRKTLPRDEVDRLASAW